MLRWATKILGKLSTTAAASPDKTECKAGAESVPQQGHKSDGPCRGAEVPPLKQWLPIADLDDPGTRAPGSPPLVSITLADAESDDGYCSPGVVEFSASLSFSPPVPHALSGTNTLTKEDNTETNPNNGGSAASAFITADMSDEKDDVGDFLQSVIAGKTDVLRKQLAQQKLEAAAASANAGHNNSHVTTRGGGSRTDGSAGNPKLSLIAATMSPSMGSAPSGGGVATDRRRSTIAGTGTTGPPAAAGHALPKQQRYVSSAARSLQDYELIAFLGNGTFAEVTLARNKVTGEYFAVKKISKQRVKEEGCIERTFTERQLLAKLHHPFLVRLYQAFQSQTHLYLVLDFAQGGDLYYLNKQQLWNRSMKRNLVKMRYPYYQSTSSTFTPAPSAASTPAQSTQPKAPLSPPVHLATNTALQSSPPFSQAVQQSEAGTHARLEEASDFSGTVTTHRDTLLMSLSMADGVGVNTVSSASRSGITVTNTATGETQPLAWTQDGCASGLADTTTNDVSATATQQEDLQGRSKDTVKVDGPIEEEDKARRPLPVAAPRPQQHGRREQRVVLHGPDTDTQLAADWRYYTTDAVDEFATSRNTESRSPLTNLTAARLAETTEPSRVMGIASPVVYGSEATPLTASSASAFCEGYRRRRRTRPVTQRGDSVHGGGKEEGSRGMRSASSSSSSSAVHDDAVSRPQVGAEKSLVSPASGAVAPSSLSPAAHARHPLSSSSSSSSNTGAPGEEREEDPHATFPGAREPEVDPAATCLSAATQAPTPHKHARAESSGKNYEDTGESPQDRESSSASSAISKLSRAEAKRRHLRRASAAELADTLAVAAASAKMVTASSETTPRSTRNEGTRVIIKSKAGSSAPQSTAEAKESLHHSNGSSSTSTHTAVASGRGVTGATAVPLQGAHDQSNKTTAARKTRRMYADTGVPHASGGIADAARPSRDFVTTEAYAAGIAAADAAAFRVDLAAPFRQVAMDGSRSALSTLASASMAPDEAHRFPLRLIAFYAVEVALVLQYLHGEGFLYRDLKPENILMRSDGHVMLTDFGVAKYRKGTVIAPSVPGDGTTAEDGGSLSSSAGAGTDGRTNSFTGTTQYMSPEMLRGQPHDSRTDWWSYGCLLFEWANGRKAFDAPNQFVLFRSIVEENVKVTAEDYRLTLLEVHTRVAQLHYRAEEVRLELEERVARHLRRIPTPMPQPGKQSVTLSALSAEVVYNTNRRGFEVRLRSATKPVSPPPQPAADPAVSCIETPETAVVVSAGDNNDTSRHQGTGPYTLCQHVHPLQSLVGPSPYPATTVNEAAAAAAAAAAALNNSLVSPYRTGDAARGWSADDDAHGIPSQSMLNDSFAASSFAGIGSSSLVSHSRVPTNLSMRLTTTEDGTIAALVSSASSTALQRQRQEEHQERRRRHQRRRMRLSCLALDEATRDRYITHALAQMDEAQTLLRDLTMRLLDRRVEHRLSGEAVLEHPFFTCSYVVSQLYYNVYHQRILSTEARRSVRTALNSMNSPADLAASSLDDPQQQIPASIASIASSLAAADLTTAATGAATAAPQWNGCLPVLPLPPQTRPDDWRQLFMERQIPAPYAPRLRTRDDLRYFPAAVTATGLSAAAEQHRRIKEAKEHQKEMMMRANNTAATVLNNSFGSNSGGGPLLLVPLDTEAAQQVHQLLAASSNTLNMQHNRSVSVLSELNIDESEAALQIDKNDTAVEVSHAAAASIPLTALSAHAPNDITQQKPLAPTLQLSVVDVEEAPVAPSSNAPSPAKSKQDVPLGISADQYAREAEDTGEDQRQQHCLSDGSGPVVARVGNTAATSTATTTTARTEGTCETVSVVDPDAVSTCSHVAQLPHVKHYSPAMGSANVSCANSSTSVSRLSRTPLSKASTEGLRCGNGSSPRSAAGDEARPDLFDRAATLPQSFLDAALLVAAAAQKKQQQQQHASYPAPACRTPSVDPSKTYHSSAVPEDGAEMAAAAATDVSYASASTDVTLMSAGADASTSMEGTHVLHGTSLLRQQQQLTKAYGETPDNSPPSMSFEIEHATTTVAAAATTTTADCALNGTVPACGGVGAHSPADVPTVAEVSGSPAEKMENETDDGGGGYYEQDAFAEEDTHVMGEEKGTGDDGAGDSDGAVSALKETDVSTVTIMDQSYITDNTSTRERSSGDDSTASAQSLTPVQQGTLTNVPLALSSLNTSRIRKSCSNPLSPGGGGSSSSSSGSRPHRDGSREGVLFTGPLTIAPVKAFPSASIPSVFLGRSQVPLCDTPTLLLHRTPEGTLEPTSPTPAAAMTPINNGSEIRGELGSFTGSPGCATASTTTTTLFDNSRRSPSTSFGDSGVGGSYEASSACATPPPAEAHAPLRGRPQPTDHRFLHYCPPSSFLGEQLTQQLFSAATPVWKPSLEAAPPYPDTMHSPQVGITLSDAVQPSEVNDAVPWADAAHRATEPSHVSTPTATGERSVVSVYLLANDDEVSVADEMGCKEGPDVVFRSRSGGNGVDNHNDTTTRSSSERSTEEEAVKKGKNNSGGESGQSQSSTSSISRTSSSSSPPSSENTFTMSSGASSVNLMDDSDAARPADTVAAALYQTPMGSPITNLVVTNPRGAMHGGATSSPSGVPRDMMADGNIKEYGSPIANVLCSGDSASTDRFVSSALSPYPSVNNTSVSGEMSGPFGPLTTTLSGIAYNVDEELNPDMFTQTPLSPCATGRAPLRRKDSFPAHMGGVQAIWAQQQRRRIARGLQKLHRKQSPPDTSAEKPLPYETGAEGERPDSSGSEENPSCDSTHENAAALSDTGQVLGFTFNAVAELPWRRRSDNASTNLKPTYRRPRRWTQQNIHDAPPRPSTQHPPPYPGDVSDDDAGNYNASPTGQDGSRVQRLLALSRSGSEDGRSYSRHDDKGQRNSSSTLSGHEIRSDSRAGASSDGNNGTSGGFDHFQNFSFTSPQILQQYLASSSAAATAAATATVAPLLSPSGGVGGGGSGREGGGHRRESNNEKAHLPQRPRRFHHMDGGKGKKA